MLLKLLELALELNVWVWPCALARESLPALEPCASYRLPLHVHSVQRNDTIRYKLVKNKSPHYSENSVSINV